MKFLLFAALSVLSLLSVGDLSAADRGDRSVKIDYDSFDYKSDEASDLNINFCKIKNAQGISFESAKNKYDLKLFFRSKIERQTWFGFNETFVLPSEEPYDGALILNDRGDTQVVRLNTFVLYENGDNKNYVMVGDKARVELFTDSKGALSSVAVICYLKKDGAKNYNNFLQKIKADHFSEQIAPSFSWQINENHFG